MGEVEKPGVKEIVASLTPAYMVSSNLQNKHTNVHIDTPGVHLNSLNSHVVFEQDRY